MLNVNEHCATYNQGAKFGILFANILLQYKMINKFSSYQDKLFSHYHRIEIGLSSMRQQCEIFLSYTVLLRTPL